MIRYKAEESNSYRVDMSGRLVRENSRKHLQHLARPSMEGYLGEEKPVVKEKDKESREGQREKTWQFYEDE